MGNNINKERIHQILKKCEKNPYLDIKYHITLKPNKKEGQDKSNIEENKLNKEEEEACEQNDNNDDSFHFEDELPVFSPKLIVKNVNEYPYNSVGTLIVKFDKEEFEYTCFLIYPHVVITLASNLINKNGEKAKYIITTFSNEEVKWENIYIEEDKENKENSKKKNKLAGIIYKNNYFEEYLGAEEDSSGIFYIDSKAIISYGYKKNDNINICSENVNKEERKENQVKKNMKHL